MLKFPSQVVQNQYGSCLIAAEDLEIGVVVEKFEGPIVPYEDVPEDQKIYVLGLKGRLWLIPKTNARFINHACDPNCTINDQQEVFTIRPVKKGEELTFSYNEIDREYYLQHAQEYFWDERWTFQCQCGAAKCLGRIDGYVFDNDYSRAPQIQAEK